MIEAALLAAVVAAGSMQAVETPRPSVALRRLLDEDWEARLREDPLLATSTGDHRYDDRLPSVAPADLEKAAGRERAMLARVLAIPRAGLETEDRISADTFAAKIRELRAKAEAELGPKFDLRAFHDAVLANGPVPLPVLEEQIRDFIAAHR